MPDDDLIGANEAARRLGISASGMARRLMGWERRKGLISVGMTLYRGRLYRWGDIRQIWDRMLRISSRANAGQNRAGPSPEALEGFDRVLKDLAE